MYPERKYCTKAIANSKIKLNPWILWDDRDGFIYVLEKDREKFTDSGASVKTNTTTSVIHVEELVKRLDDCEFTGDGDHDVSFLNHIADTLEKVCGEKGANK